MKIFFLIKFEIVIMNLIKKLTFKSRKKKKDMHFVCCLCWFQILIS